MGPFRAWLFIFLLKGHYYLAMSTRSRFLVTVVGCTGLGILDTQPSRQWTEPVTMALMFFGKLGSSSVLTILYIYTAEVFPTSLR